ncbi:hypothetical protein VTJ83DRAFT_4384 [Remersonia thermophila]|uniref:Uncharacterized protein n=1 Tax=Remersonia thermophila TaxID=72144 RepID=A0ABR4DBZ2_9PEZI
MDFINKMTGGNQGSQAPGQATNTQQTQSRNTSGGGLMDKLHGMVGGGPESEKKEDALDKGIDWVQENVLKEGQQSNESAAEQAKDRFIAGQIRSGYRSATGKEFPGSQRQ